MAVTNSCLGNELGTKISESIFYSKIPEYSQNINNLYHADFFQTIFHSFQAGIANAISSSKSRKIVIFMKNIHLQNVIIYYYSMYRDI